MATTDDTGESPTPPIDDARAELQAAVPEAAETLRDLLDAEDERVQIRAAETILDRAGLSKAKKVSSGGAQKDVGGEPSSSPFGSDDPTENLF